MAKYLVSSSLVEKRCPCERNRSPVGLRTAHAMPLGDPSMPAGSEVPDLFADNIRLSQIATIRDVIRSLRREARSFDAESELSARSCEADLQRYVLLLCGRIIGGQNRDLNERDRVFLD